MIVLCWVSGLGLGLHQSKREDEKIYILKHIFMKPVSQQSMYLELNGLIAWMENLNNYFVG